MRNVINVLALESSCDDTSAAILSAHSGDKIPRVHSMAVQSQWDVHERYGGVVPELASRAHLRNLLPCISKVLNESGMTLSDISAFAATNEPGLVGCLLVAHCAAKTLSFLFNKPFLSCNHIHSHLMSVFLEHQPNFPFLELVVSGGHTSLFCVRNYDEFEPLGIALDDAAGEAFDKGAKLLGLGFPGGPEIDRLAQTGDLKRYAFGKVQTKDLHFSFSGLKSELVRIVKREGESISKPDLAASYQRAIIGHLLSKVEIAMETLNIRDIAIVGGVARNSALRATLDEWKAQKKIKNWYAPSPDLCTDNAAMVGALAYRKFLRNEFSELSEDVRSTSRRRKTGS